MKKRPDFIILVEHAARELDTACLLKYLVEERDTTVEVISLPYFYADHVNDCSGVLVVPYCYSLGIYRSILPHFNDISMINLAYEQIFATITENIKAPKDEFGKKCVVHHAWSRNYFNFLVKYDVDPANIIINGNLSLALYKYPYRNYFMARETLAHKFHLDLTKKWLFIPENYAAAFYTQDTANEKISLGMDPVDLIKYQEFATKSLQSVIKWLAIVSKSDDIEIIFRPRPATSYEKMNNFFINEIHEIPEHIHIIKDETVREWILASDIIMSSYSTTLIEAAIAEKPIAMLEPIPFPDFLYVPWYDFVPKIQDYDDFIKVISSPSPDSYQSLKTWAETEMMSNGDPIQGVVNLMLSVKKSGIRIPESYTKRPEESLIKRITHKCFDHYGSLKRKMKVQQIVDDYENDFFTNADVTNRVARWKKVLENV